MVNNKRSGNEFEERLCEYLADAGWWAHNMLPNHSGGQPADVIAVRDGNAFLIDCKDCSNDVFQMSRIEANQYSAMDYWEQCGNGVGLFALRMSDDTVYMVNYHDLCDHGASTIGFKDILEIGVPLDRWTDEN